MTPHTQTIMASRADGHTHAGMPGNCLQAAVASMLDLPLEGVPHFAIYADWWSAMRRWLREARGMDWAYVAFPVSGDQGDWWDRYAELGRENGWHVLLGGPSPRGPFSHVVVGNVDLELVHDPHPSRDGLVSVEDAIVLVGPYEPAPRTLELLPSDTTGGNH